MPELLVTQDFDQSLTYRQKRMWALIIGSIGWLVWGLFSTPNTIDICVRLFGSVKVLYIPYSGILMGALAGFTFSILEMAGIYLAIWKGRVWWLLVIFCGAWSVAGSFKFAAVGHETARMKYQAVQDAKMAVDEKAEAIAKSDAELADLQKIVDKYLLEKGYAPSPTLDRMDRIRERRAELEKIKDQLAADFQALKKSTGVIVTFDNLENEGSGKWGKILSVAMEALLIGCTWLSISMWRSESIEQQAALAESDAKQSTDQRIIQKKLVASSKQIESTFESESGFRPKVLSKVSTKLSKVSTPTFGFNTAETFGIESANRKRLSVADERKLQVLRFKTANPEMSNSQIGKHFGMSGQWVGQILRHKIAPYRVPVGATVAHQSDSIAYELVAYENDQAVVKAGETTKRFPASEIWDVNEKNNQLRMLAEGGAK